MIDVPDHPFRVSEVDENDPFIANAIKERKHYEPCWCGSGKKYKKCHRQREEEEPYSLGKLLSLQRKVFWRKRGCMHPLASPSVCNGKVIDSHTIQRKGPLERIVDATGHVMHFEANPRDGNANEKSIGWRKASVFPGYCSFHDSSLFDPIENDAFTGEHNKCVLHAFRNVCNEHYRKQALIESLEFQRTNLDRGFDLDRQISTQYSIFKNIEGQTKSLEETARLRDIFEDAIVREDYESFKSKCYYFKGDLDVVSSSIFQCEYDFAGNKLIDMWDLSLDAEMLSHTIVEADGGGVIIFVWINGETHPEIVVDSFNNVPDDQKGDVFVQYCFVNCENTFFSERWWSALGRSQQRLIQLYAAATYYEGGEFAANESRLVNWTMV